MNLITVADLIDQGAAELVTGPFGTQLAAHDYVDKGTPVINVRNVGFGDVRTANLEYLDAETVERLARHKLKEGDIVFGRKGAVERHAFISSHEHGWLQGSDCIRLRLDPNVMEPRFVSFAFRTEWHKRWMQNHCSSGATMASLNQDILRLLAIPSPPLTRQREVSGLLGAFDDLIKNNRRRIETLEEMARLIYREWFVHFRFPGHKEVNFVDSDFGPIPEGWTVEVTFDLISRGVLEIGDGYRAKNSEFAGTSFSFVRVKNVREGYLDLTDVDYLPEPYGERVGGKRARPGDCVISMKGTVGRMAFVGERTPPLIYSPQVSYWRPLQPDLISPEYLRLWMQSPVFVEQCARVKGATDMADYVNLRDQRAMRLAMPPATVHAAFVESVSPLLSLSDNLRSQIEVLENARDLLLPRLISGEVDVSDLSLDLEPVG